MAKSNGSYVTFAFRAMADITGTLLTPALAALLLKELYDGSSFAKPLFYTSLALALVISLLLVIRKVQRYGRLYQELIASSSDSDLESGRPGG